MGERSMVLVECEVCENEFHEHPAALPPHVCPSCDDEFGGDSERAMALDEQSEPGDG